MRRPAHSLFAIVLLVLLPVGCRTDPSSPAPPSSPEPATGTPAANICVAIADWYGRYQDELPFMGLPPSSGYTRLGIGNLFRTSAFSGVFGVPYTYEYRLVLQQKYTESVVPCYQESRHASVMNALKPMFQSTLEKFDPELSDHAARLDEKAVWMETALAEINSVPATQEGLIRLDQYRSDARDYLPWLWPSEKAAFDMKLEARRKLVAGNLITSLGPATLPATPDNIRLLHRLDPYGEAGQGGEDLQQRLQRMLSQITKEKNAEIANIPLTMEGREKSRLWYESFQRDYGEMRTNPEVIRIYQAWADRRNKVYRATKSDFMARLKQVKGGEDKAQKYRALLDETFPLPDDSSMPVYREYARESENYQKTIWGRLGEKGQWAAEKGEWVFDKISRGLSRLADDVFKNNGK